MENSTVKKLSIKRSEAKSRYILPIVPQKRVYRDNFSGFTFEDAEFKGCCCNCNEKYCISYSRNEIHSHFFNSFPHNTSYRVCPTAAISIVGDNVNINNDRCIGCGICLHRCPFSAFAYDSEKGRCFVQNNASKVAGSISVQDKQISLISSVPVIITFQNITKPFIDDKSLRIIANTDAPEIIVRNFLINMGIHTNTNAKGNQHNRIEFFALSNGNYLIGECETGNDVLSASRRILDDLAVLVSRYSINVDYIIPLAVINHLPNKRTDFYEVIEDIYKVIGVQIHTVSYACLFLLNLFNCKIDIQDFKSFVLNRSSLDLSSQLQQFIPNINNTCSLINTDYFSVQK